MKRLAILLLAGFCFVIQLSVTAQDVPLKKFDQRGIAVIDSFMKALLTYPDDEMAAAIAALPFIHRSEYDNAGTNLKRDRLDFSFKKAWQNAKFYKWYIVPTRVQKQGLTGIGFAETAEAGTAFKVWISKKEGVGGMPAPLNIFFPADGSEPKLYYYGSL